MTLSGSPSTIKSPEDAGIPLHGPVAQRSEQRTHNPKEGLHVAPTGADKHRELPAIG
jgi:hypothetical protein